MKITVTCLKKQHSIFFYPGSVDGKHIRIQKPKKSGSVNYGYKQYPSLILIIVSDAENKVLYYDSGIEGSSGDAGASAVSALNRLKEKTF